jgi:hypothetical protein
MSGPVWTLEFYEEGGREPVLDFLRGLDELKEQALAAALRNVLAYEGIGVCGSSWGKWVQGATGIFEFRVRHDAATILHERGLPAPEDLQQTSTDILLRVFCHAHGKKVTKYAVFCINTAGRSPLLEFCDGHEVRRLHQRG